MSGLDASVEWLVVGGGIHGTYIARELRESGVDPADLAIVDSHGELLASFRRKARACGTETLRSNYVQHIGPSPFGLERFAEANGRADELVPTQHSQPRPTLGLFLDHAAEVVDRFGLGELVCEATVTDIRREGDLVVETTAGSVRATRVVLAVGPGERFRRPDWARDSPRVEHVWDSHAPPASRVDAGERVWVVGGGITAAQFATAVASAAGSVVVCARSPLDVALREANPRWLNWNHIAAELHSLPPGSPARYRRVRDARNSGTVPPYLERDLHATADLELRHETITTAVESRDGLLLAGERAAGYRADRVVLATGFGRVSDSPLVGRLATSLSLARGYRGVPVLDDETLAWRRQNGDRSNVFVTGKLAAGTVGPYAGNIPGARRAAERIAP